jgi:hypothetical protein
MSAAAAALLICPAIGGLAPQYLFWPFVFILASGRLRIASVYAVISSFVYFLFFLIPGASYTPGESLGALLPLRSLAFLGLPHVALKWFSSTAALDAWHLLANLFVPLATCALGVYFMLSRSEPQTMLSAPPNEPLELRSVRTVVPYTAIMVLVVLAYGMVPTHDASAAITAIYHGVNHYAFSNSIYTWRHWRIYDYWTLKHPYRHLLNGSWWGTILVLGPLAIAAWGMFGLHASRRIAACDREAKRSST